MRQNCEERKTVSFIYIINALDVNLLEDSIQMQISCWDVGGQILAYFRIIKNDGKYSTFP